MTNAQLKAELAAGNTRRVVENLLDRTRGDVDLHAEAVALSARFQNYLREKNGGRAEPGWLDAELNRIHAAALDLIGRLPGSVALSKKINWEKIALWIGILAAVAGVTGYTFRDFFKKTDPPAVVQPAVELPKSTEKPAEIVPKSPPQPAPAVKNQTNVTVKDKAKVGIISTGDSVKFENIKQDF